MLNLYRRHTRKCGVHPEDSRSYDGDELRKTWRKCHCPIFASGTIAEKFGRRNLEVTDWTTARQIAAAIDTSGSWSATVSAPAPPAAALPSGPNGKRVDEAIREFLAYHQQHSAPNTHLGYKTFLRKLQAFSDAKGILDLRQFEPSDIRTFRDSWTIARDNEVVPVSRGTLVKNMSALKAFFEFWVEDRKIERNPARIRNPRGGDTRDTQKLPFTDAEIERMLNCCVHEYGRQLVKWDRDVHHCQAVHTVNQYARKWTGQDLADFILLSIHTGLRISDAEAFHIDRIDQDGRCRVRQRKNGTWVSTKMQPWLIERLQARSERVGPRIFGTHTTENTNVYTDVVRRRLNGLWELCGPWDARTTPHRFRHTFARILLQNGTSIADVAELMGDTDAIVRKHYAAWVPERQERLDAIMDKVSKRLPVLPGMTPQDPAGKVVEFKRKRKTG